MGHPRRSTRGSRRLPWLIARFTDSQAEFLFVAADQVLEVAAREAAIPFDVPGVDLGHHGQHCSFDAFLDKHGLVDAALQRLAEIVRGADTGALHLTPESARLYALASGFREIVRDDHENLQPQFPTYDALYRFCQLSVRQGG